MTTSKINQKRKALFFQEWLGLPSGKFQSWKVAFHLSIIIHILTMKALIHCYRVITVFNIVPVLWVAIVWNILGVWSRFWWEHTESSFETLKECYLPDLVASTAVLHCHLQKLDGVLPCLKTAYYKYLYKLVRTHLGRQIHLQECCGKQTWWYDYPHRHSPSL